MDPISRLATAKSDWICAFRTLPPETLSRPIPNPAPKQKSPIWSPAPVPSSARKLGAAAVSVADANVVRASLPSNPEAQRLYSEGLAKLRSFDTLAARDLFQKAIQADPQFPLAHSALSTAWTQLGYDGKGRDEIEKAFNLSAGLSHEEQLDIEGRYRVASKEWDKAIAIYRSLFEVFPDNLDYGLRLADAQDFVR